MYGYVCIEFQYKYIYIHTYVSAGRKAYYLPTFRDYYTLKSLEPEEGRNLLGKFWGFCSASA